MVDMWLPFSFPGEMLADMGRRRTRVNLSNAQLDELRRRLRVARDTREKERLRFALRAASGDYTLEELAELTGRVRATMQNWLKKLHAGGIPGLLDRDTPPGSISPLAAPDIQTQLRAGLAAGRWQSAGQVAMWLKETYGIERATKSVYYWLAKNRSLAQRQAH